jgi:ribonuclease Z
MRLADLRIPIGAIQFGFITHYHVDHLSEVYDAMYIRALNIPPNPPLTVHAAVGNVTLTLQSQDDPYLPDANHRRIFIPAYNPQLNIVNFTPTSSLQQIFSSVTRNVNVSTNLVQHEMDNAVGYRVTTPIGVVAYSGDGRVDVGLTQLCNGADLCTVNSFLDGVPQQTFFPLIHANSTRVGTMGKTLNTPVLMMTHLMPPPSPGLNNITDQTWINSVAGKGGFSNRLMIAHDLDEVKWGLMKINSFTFLNRKTGQEIPLVHGATVVFDDDDKLTIRANLGVGASDVNRVRFEVDNHFEFESTQTPHYIRGKNQNGKPRDWDVPTGTHVISAAAYNDAADIFGPPLFVTITFTCEAK